MERIEFIREQLRSLDNSELLDLVCMIQYELSVGWRHPSPKTQTKYKELCAVVAKWEEDRTNAKDATPS